jgi:gastric triacylglycerol lipase
MADHDIPAAFKYIAEKTKQKVNYIGHSQGTVIMLAALVSAKKKLVLDNVGEIILLAAFASLTDIGKAAEFILGENFLRVLK